MTARPANRSELCHTRVVPGSMDNSGDASTPATPDGVVSDQSPIEIRDAAPTTSEVSADAPSDARPTEGDAATAVQPEDGAAPIAKAQPSEALVTDDSAKQKKQKQKKQKESKKPSVRLTEPELRQRISRHSPGLVEEIQAIAIRQNQLEEARESRLDAKSGGLLGTASLSLTVAFTFGGLLLQHPDFLKPLGPWCARAVLVAYVVALVLGLSAVLWAVRALFVSEEYQALSDEAVFNDDELRFCDQKYLASKADENVADESRLIYRRYITVPLWEMYRAHQAIHERKAKTIGWGQRMFFGFLSVLIVIGALMTYAAYEQYAKVEAAPVTAPCIDL